MTHAWKRTTHLPVKRYQAEEKPLTAAGYGESRPKGTNETLEGRARNRRVELVR